MQCLDLAYIRSIEAVMTARALARPLVPASFPLGGAWFLVCGLAGRPIENDIKALGFETFAPQMERRTLVRGRRIKQKSSLFPGYLFANFDRERDDWGGILNVDGVIDILKNDQIPVRVPDSEIARLQRAEQIGLFDFTNDAANFRIGELVEIDGDGLFKGMLARIKSATAKKRVKILLETLGAIEIDPAMLRRV